MKRSARRLMTSLSIACFLLITISLILIRNSVATGYELSIYAATPTLAWIFLAFSIAGGIGILVHQSFTASKSCFWAIGFSIVIFSNAIIVFLPALRGYYYPNFGDPLAQVGIISDLISTGHFDTTTNLYPIAHILTTQVAEICSIPVSTVAMYLPGIFSIFYMLSTYLLASVILRRRGPLLLTLAASATFLFSSFHASFYPHGLSTLLLPLVFYLYFRGLQRSLAGFRAAFVALLLIYPFLYPESSLMIVLLLSTMEFFKGVYSVLSKAGSFRESMSRISLNATFIAFIPLFMWVSSHYIFGIAMRKIFGTMRGEPYEAQFVSKGVQVVQHLQGLDLVEFSLKMYGHDLVFVALSAVASLIIWRKVLRQESGMENLFLLALVFLFSPIFEFVISMSTQMHQVGRILGLSYMLFATPVLVGFGLYELLTKVRVNRGALMATAILILCWLQLLAYWACTALRMSYSQICKPHIAKSRAQTGCLLTMIPDS